MYYTYQDTKLYYRIIGQGRTVLLIHGLGCSAELMEGCMEPVFAQQDGYQRIYLDLPGMGRSDANPAFASADAILDLLLHFIDELIGQESFLLAGESYGGYLSRGILAQKMDQIAGLLLICPVTHPNPQDRILPESRLVVRDSDFDPEVKDEDFLSLGILQTEETYQRFEEEIRIGLSMMNPDFIQQLQESYALSFNPDRVIKAKKYSKPSLFIAGKQDQVVGYQQLADLAQYYPRASYIVLDLAGHNAQIDRSGLFQSLVEDWLDRVRLG